MKEEALNKRRKLYIYLRQTNAIFAEDDLHKAAFALRFSDCKHRKCKAVVQAVSAEGWVSGTGTEKNYRTPYEGRGGQLQILLTAHRRSTPAPCHVLIREDESLSFA